MLALVSRQDKISLERLTIKYRIMRDNEMVPMKFTSTKKSNTFFVYGLWLYGAKWDQTRATICDLNANDLTGNEIPTIQLDIEEYNPLGNVEINGDLIEAEQQKYRGYDATTDSIKTDSEFDGSYKGS